MVGPKRIAPIVFLALGAGGTYYGLSFAYPPGLPLPRALASFLLGAALIGSVVLRPLGKAPFPSLLGKTPVAALRRFHRGWQALCLGVPLGLVVYATGVTALSSWGVDPLSVRSLTLKITEDPRSIKGNRLLVRGRIQALDAQVQGNRIRILGDRGTVTAFVGPDRSSGILGTGRGATVFLEGKTIPPSTSTKGLFSFGNSWVFNATGSQILGSPPPLDRLRTLVRNRLLDTLRGQSWGGLSAALLVGYRDYLDDDIEQGYRKAGCAPVLALSGMHLAVITALLALALKRPLGLKAAAVAGGVVVFLYAWFVGPQPSLVRSVLMYLLGATAIVVGFPRPTASILALAFLGQMGADPPSALSLSFILSYLALGGILFFSEGFTDFLRPFFGPALGPSVSVSLGAFLATMAVVGSSFGILYPIGLGASLVVVPLAIFMMLGTLLWLPFHFVLPPLSLPLTGLLNLVYGVNGTVITLAARFPGVPIPLPMVLIPLTLAISLILVYGRYGSQTKRNRLEPFN